MLKGRVSAVNKSENQDIILSLCFQNSHQKVRSPELNLKKWARFTHHFLNQNKDSKNNNNSFIISIPQNYKPCNDFLALFQSELYNLSYC